MFHSLKIFYHTDEQTKLDWPHSKQKMCASEQEVMPGIEKGIMGWQKHQLARNTKILQCLCIKDLGLQCIQKNLTDCKEEVNKSKIIIAVFNTALLERVRKSREKSQY